MSDLTDAFRAKYPDSYKDLSDDDLEKAIISKYPAYASHPAASANSNSAEPSLLSKIWAKATAPLTEAPSRFGDYLSNKIDPNRGTKGFRSVASGFVENLGHEISGLTSPLSISLAGASTGAKVASELGAPLVAQGVKWASRAASVPLLSQGIHDTITKPHLDEKLGGAAQAILGAMGLAEGNFGRITEESKVRPGEIKYHEAPGFPEGNVKTRLAELTDKARASNLTDAELAEAQKLNKLVRDPVNQYSDKPLNIPELPVSELPPDLVPIGEESAFNKPRTTEAVNNPEDKLYQLAKEKQGMGKELPVEETKPTATFKGMQADANGEEIPQFDIKGGKLDGSTVGVDTLKKENIDVPEITDTPAKQQGMSVDDIFNKPAGKSAFNFNDGRFRNTPKGNSDSLFSRIKGDEAFQNATYPTEKAAPEVAADRVANPNKPRYRLDNASGGLIPIDANGEPIGQTIYPKSSLSDETPPGGSFGGKPPEQGDMGFGKGNEPPDKSSLLQKIYDTPRGLMSVDLPYMTSAAFRQASPYVGTADWFKAWAPAAKSFGSKEAYDAVNAEINNRPRFKSNVEGVASQASQDGLALTDLGKYSRREESLRGELAEKIPVYGRYVAASNRAYTAFLNTLRANRYDDLMDGLEADGIATRQNRQQVANAINTLTGRAKLALHPNATRNIEGASKVLSNIFFSPRKIASELQMLNPATYVMTNPVARKELLAGAIRRVGIWWGVAGLAQLAGAEVSHDPTNPDFGKVKIGDTRIDPPGGLQQYLVLGSQLVKGGKTSSTSGKFTGFGSKFGADTAFDDVSNFTTNRFHPTAKYLVDLAKSKKSSPFYAGDHAFQLALPMFTQDLAQIARENPKLVPMLLGAPLSGVGIGVQSYNKKSFTDPVFLLHQYDLRIPAAR